MAELCIKLDNAAMQTAFEIADALLVVEGQVRDGRTAAVIRDSNGSYGILRHTKGVKSGA